MTVNDFSNGVLKETNQINLNEKYLKSLKIIEGITIDDVNSKDLDDGFQLETDSDGWILYVSIADAASYIDKDSRIFESARNSVNTIYLPGKKIPMLPAELSENKLSLLEKKIRPALTFKISLSPEIDILDFEVIKTAFKSRRQLSYRLTDEILAREKPDKEFGHLAECYHLANLLLEKRRDKGALVIYDFIRGMYTNEEGQIIINRNQRLHMANIIVQEFMILTNSAAAEFFIKRNKQLILRNHTAKSTTPPRDEIYSQYILAKNNPATIDTLKRRIDLWFEKAEYSTKLIGHFGLNLPAYTHITSPLRRFPDLANQYIIHSFISGKRTPFSKDTLSKLALRINRNLRKIKDSKINHHKEKAVKELLEIAESETPGIFDNIDNKKFKSVLNQACVNNNISKELADETEKRILAGSIGTEHLVYLLFELKKNNVYYNKFFRASFEFLRRQPGSGSSLINIATQKKYLPEIKREIRMLPGGFSEIITMIKKGTTYSSPEIQIKKSKKDASNSSALDFLENYFGDKLVPAAEMKFAETKLPSQEKNNPEETAEVKTQIHPEDSEPAKNHAGRLYELCMKNKIFSFPEFTFSQSGPSNNSIFDCTCIVKCEGTIFETNSTSRKKITAKHLASKEMKEKLEHYLINLQHTIKQPAEREFTKENRKQKISVENYAGTLEILCARYKNIFKAEYEFTEEISKDKGYRHTCICKVSIKDDVFSATDIQNSKKETKQAVSKKIIDILTEKSIIGKNSNGEYEIIESTGIYEPLLNYTGMLNKIISGNNNFSEPDYEFSFSGTPHKPEITFRCRLTADNRGLITEYTSVKKSVSKQKTAFLMIKKLLDIYAEEVPAERKTEGIEILFNPDPEDTIKKTNNFKFKYALFKWINTVSPLFSCLPELQNDNSKFEIVTTETTIEKAVSKSKKILTEYLTNGLIRNPVINIS